MCDSLIEVLAEVWDHFFTETLPTLQAIFYPVQGQELTIRQISLLGFRDLVLLKVSTGKACPLRHKQRNNLAAVMEVGSRANAVQSG
ncbi:hypothetical protein U0070_024319 [Myodes glareolus]|uniref:Uncharacterized protein n=1 Tax=Myodes glareolus TaxID=447135 RepID=A0AAW0ILD4_MYOGA